MSKILILGASGMLGYAMHKIMSEGSYDVIGVIRSSSKICDSNLKYERIDDIQDFISLRELLLEQRPDVVINCVGVIKQAKESSNVDYLYRINSFLPKFLAVLASELDFNVIHFSTDCIFDGKKGCYGDGDYCNATDSYGISKYLGEIESPKVLNIRTSIIGHGINVNNSLVDWFLSQHGQVKGFKNAIFSGLPVDFIGKTVLSKFEQIKCMSGTYNLSANPISKFDLLSLIKLTYDRQDIIIEADEDFVIDRSLNSELLRSILGINIPDWESLVSHMYEFYRK